MEYTKNILHFTQGAENLTYQALLDEDQTSPRLPQKDAVPDDTVQQCPANIMY